MAELLFGTAGVPRSTQASSTTSGIEHIAELGLGCMEIEFVRGVRMNEEGAASVAETATRRGIKLSAHAPYYINLNAHQPEKIRASQQRILQTARIASLCGAESIVFHTGFYLDDPPEEVYDTVKKYLTEILNQLKRENNKITIRPEVLGKRSQFGTLDELFNLCSELEGLAPCIDFSHWHARTGKFNSYEEFASVLSQLEQRLGRAALDDMHIHLSGIHYGAKGELKHLNLKESDLHYTELLQALKDCQAKGIVICESPNLEEDALLLQATYNTLPKSD
jgi:deoxyribonuclease-4